MANREKRQPTDYYYVWCDLETTGLDPVTNTILEITVMVTDTNLRTLLEPVTYAIGSLNGCEPFIESEKVLKMHTDNNLLKECRDSTISLEEAEIRVLTALKTVVKEGLGLLAGNSIHFDRSFIKLYMPRLDKHLHYRMLDVSSIGQFVKTIVPVEEKKKRYAHRTESDVLESIEEYKQYFKVIYQNINLEAYKVAGIKKALD